MIKLKLRPGQLRKFSAALSNTRGETIIEAIVSMIVFAVFTLTVITAILVSQRITAVSTRDAKIRQDQVNAAMLKDDGYTAGTLDIKTTDVGSSIEISIPIETFSQDGLFAFRPKQEVAGP